LRVGNSLRPKVFDEDPLGLGEVVG